MVDPTSDLGEDVTEENAPVCETCEKPIVRLPTHRVVSSIEDGTAVHLHFCDDDCKADFFA